MPKELPANDPFATLLGIEMYEHGDGYARGRVVVRPELMNPHVTLHGGVMYSLADQSMGAAVYTRLEPGESCATIEIKMVYIAAVREGTLDCETRVVNKGRRVAVLGEQAAQVVRATRYAPEGKRGLGAAVARVSGWGQIADYATSANAEIGVIVQAETRAAIENLDDILAVEGVDCVFIGPADLSADMGYLGNPGAEEVQAVIADAGRRIRAAGKAAGILHYDSTDYPRYLDLGFNFLGIGADVSLMRTSFAATLAIARAAVKG